MNRRSMNVGMVRAAALACVVSCVVASSSVAADDLGKYPDKPVRIVLGFSAGSPSDVASRVIGEKLAERWKQPFLTEYRAGAGGSIAAQSVARAAPDGHTLLGVSASHVIQPALSASPLYSAQDFVGITTTIGLANVLVVSPSLGVKTVQELVALAKATPGGLLFSSGGVGSGTHFSAELFKSLAAIEARHVPFRGIPEALTEVVAGRIHFTFSPLSNVLPLLGTSEVVALAVAPGRRASALPNVPTIAEAGVAGYAWDTWFGLVAPAKTPSAIVKALNREIVEVIQRPDVKKRWEPIGAEALPMTPEAFDRYLSEQARLVDKLVTAANIKVK